MSDKPTANSNMEREVAHFLATGEADPLGSAFPGRHTLERLTGYERHLRKALVDEVRQREQGHRHRHVPPGFDPSAWTRRKVHPMIGGLFSAAEQQALLDMAARSIVFLTRKETHRLLRQIDYLESAWTIANMYLLSLCAPTLGNGRLAVGLSEETKCYVSMEYFAETAPEHVYRTVKCPRGVRVCRLARAKRCRK